MKLLSRAMSAGATSWHTTTASPARVAEALAAAHGDTSKPSAGIVFVSGALAHRLLDVASAIAETKLGIPVIVAAGAGVLTEAGEIEGQSAAAGIVWQWSGGVEMCSIAVSKELDVGEALAQLLADRTSRSSPTVIAFLSSERFSPAALLPLREARGTPYLFGAGTIGHPGAASIGADGTIDQGPVVMILRGGTPPAIRTTHCCRLLAPLLPITQSHGAMVLRIAERPALDVLSELGRGLSDRPLVFTVLAEPEGVGELQGGRPELIVRGVQGVDSDRGGLVVSNEVREGMRITFAVRDGKASRDDLEAIARELQRDLAGAAPRFGLYLNCAGRGAELYGAADVDTRILKSRFPAVPFAGMQSSFEIAPHLGRATLQLYTGVLGLFASPS